MKIKKKLEINKILEILLLSLTVLGFIGSLIYVINNPTDSRNINIIMILPFLFFLTPYLVMKLYDVKKIESKMSVIPRFLRDIVDNVESGMDLISSIKNTTENEYTVLNEDIKKLSNQLGWGINFEVALLNFAKNIGSKSLQRDLVLVIEARKIGGHVEQLLRELSEKINTENLRNSQRKSNLSSNTFTGYVSFGIFVFIIVIVYNSLFLDLSSSMGSDSENSIQVNDDMAKYLTLLMLLAYELALLSGFLFGLMQENNIISGAPHVVALMIITFLGFFFFIQY